VVETFAMFLTSFRYFITTPEVQLLSFQRFDELLREILKFAKTRSPITAQCPDLCNGQIFRGFCGAVSESGVVIPSLLLYHAVSFGIRDTIMIGFLSIPTPESVLKTIRRVFNHYDLRNGSMRVFTDSTTSCHQSRACPGWEFQWRRPAQRYH
jgi:hypothetical protein